jgi:hypothetical protein
MLDRRRWVGVIAILGLAFGCSSDSSEGAKVTTASVTKPPVARSYSARVVDEVQVDPAYRQGLARVDGGWAFSVNNGLFLTDDALNQKARVGSAIPDEWRVRGFNHIGDIDVANGVLYAPLEQPDYDRGRQAMLTYDPKTLSYTGGREVAQHENSFVTVDPATRIAYSMDRFGGDALLRYDVGADWKVLEPVKMSRFVDKVQGGDVHDDAVWLSTDDAMEGVYRVDLETGRVDVLGSIGHVDGEGEGIDATPRPAADLHVLSIDANVATVRLIELKVATG